MNTVLAITALLLAGIPCVLFVRNLWSYLPLPSPRGGGVVSCSVLIPARNEELNIEAALQSVLQSVGVEIEVLVMDDGSTDRTGEIVQRIAATDPRIRLESAGPLPPDWCGKNFACWGLASLARHPLLIFMDADVRVSRPDSLARLARFVEESGAALVSGVPLQQTRSLMERLIVPLIHFVLLSYLPLRQMRQSTDPRFAAACGQILAVRREAYETAGGHAAISNRIHDAVALARSFRKSGLRTDLFDATDTFHCRMYRTGIEVWRGFAKNAHEGLGSARLIGPASLLLLGGQALPLVGLVMSSSMNSAILWALAVAAAYIPRLLAAARFRQPFAEAILHPVGIFLLVLIQWDAFFRALRRSPAVWKSRAYVPASLP